MEIELLDYPIYSVGDAARYLTIPQATLRSWTVGRRYQRQDGVAEFEPIIRLPDPTDPRLSFSNLVEAHVLRALRTKHGVSIQAVREALTYAEERLRVERLLLSDQLMTAAGNLFLERYGDLINLTKSGQLAVRKLLEAHLVRVDRAKSLPARLFPFLPGHVAGEEPRPIVIDPGVSFGRPTITGKGISTEAVVRRIDAGESIDDLAGDYSLTREEIEAAVVYERAA